MTICRNCNRSFPDYLISPMSVDGTSTLVCPICALKIRNKVQGLPEDTPFQGGVSQAMRYEEAVEFIRSEEGHAD